MSVQHKDLANGRWAEMSLCEQMANIGSEISRALNWQKKGNDQLSKNAVNRALELIGLSIAATSEYPRLKELTRTREAIIDYFYGTNEYASSESLWRSYFDHFVYAFRNKKTES